MNLDVPELIMVMHEFPSRQKLHIEFLNTFVLLSCEEDRAASQATFHGLLSVPQTSQIYSVSSLCIVGHSSKDTLSPYFCTIYFFLII